MKAMISQPMAGKTEKEIFEDRERAIEFLESEGFEVVNTLFTDEWYSENSMNERGFKHKYVYFIAKSIENMANVDVVYFLKGWADARGCKIENVIAQEYGIQTMYENWR